MIAKLGEQKQNFIRFTEMYGLQEHMREVVRLINDGTYLLVDGDLIFKAKNEINTLSKLD